ncbi:MAG: imidazoleglycerol-phosphate dehydratase, partial [Proteobacteria bacterium]|nr:imidazoleglycerol-phosphate dehydratase [Pseudomonadota bacterium]
MDMRTAKITRTTKETDISLELTLDGTGRIEVATGVGFADHMLTLFAFWARMDISLSCKGDLEIDAHHSLEDVGLVLGEALAVALGDKRGIQRVASAKVPMDEALAEVVVDLSGRPYLVYRGEDLVPDTIAGDEKDVWREFFKSLAFKAGMNLHISY